MRVLGGKTGRKAGGLCAAAVGFLITAMSLTICTALPVRAEEGPDIVIVYDEAQTDTGAAGPEDILRLVKACGGAADTLTLDQYARREKDYRHRITLTPLMLEKGVDEKGPVFCIGQGYENYFAGLKITNVSVTDAVVDYGGRSGSTGAVSDFPCITAYTGSHAGKVSLAFDRKFPFSVMRDGNYYIPYVGRSDYSAAVCGELLHDFLGAGQKGGLYVNIDEVYAFSDLELLTSWSLELKNHGIPFIVSVMPVYDNYGGEAFEQFAEALRYVQRMGGTVALADPILYPQIKGSEEEQNERIRIMKEAFSQLGVAVLEPELEPYPVSLEELTALNWEGKAFEPFSFDMEVILALPENLEAALRTTDLLSEGWYPFCDVRDLYPNLSFSWQREEEEEIVPEREVPRKYETFFRRGNLFLLFAVGISIVVFLMILLIGRRLYKKKFYRP